MSVDNDDTLNNISGNTFLNLSNFGSKNESKKRYTERIKVGEGGQATVYKVYDTHLSAFRAMKMMHSQFSSNKEFVQYYINEVKITSQLNFPNIVKVYDADVEDTNLFIIMDYIEGKNLSTYTKLPESIACTLIIRILEALNYAHEAKINVEGHTANGIIHGDIKPDNIIIRDDGEAMILDFGLSDVSLDERTSASSITLGTWAYAAPEQFNNEKISVQSDIYAVGVTLVKLLTGLTYFENMSQLVIMKSKSNNYCDIIDTSNITPDLVNIINKATNYNKSERYNNASEFKKDLEEYINHNYIISNTYKNILGAYFNFKMEPQAKKKEQINTSEKKRRIKKNNSDDNSNKHGKKYILLFIFLILLGSIIFGVLKLGPLGAAKKQKDYILVIKNSKEIPADIFQNDKSIGVLKKGEVNKKIFFHKKGEYPISIINKDYEKINKTISFTSETRIDTLYYNPRNLSDKKKRKSAKKISPHKREIVKYVLKIKNPKLKNEIYYIDGKKIGKLKGKRTVIYEFKKGGTHTIKVGNISEDIYFSKSKPEREWLYSPSQSKPDIGNKDTKKSKKGTYSLSINNPQKLLGKVFANGEKIGVIKSEGLNSFTLKKSGDIEIVIKNKDRDDFITNISVSKASNSVTITYNPPIYTLTIRNPKNIDAKIKVKGEKQQNLLENPIVKLFKRGSYDIKIVDNTGQYKVFKKTVDFTESERTVYVDYIPESVNKFSITIKNPQNITGTVVLNNETYTLEGNFHREFKSEQIVTIIVKAKGYENTSFVADFHEKDFFPFVYNPSLKKVELGIQNLPIGSIVKVSDETGKISQQKATGNSMQIPNLDFGKKYNISITKYPDYEPFTKTITLSDENKTIIYSGKKQFGSIQFKPGLPETALKHISIWLDDKRINNLSELDKISPGKHNIALVYKVGQQSNRIPKSVSVKPKIPTSVNLNIDIVEIKSNIPNVKIYSGVNLLGKCPVMAFFSNSTLETITAKFPNGKVKKETINPKKEHIVTFNSFNPKAELAYLKADSLLSDYNFTKDNSVKNKLLIDADVKLQEAIELDPTFKKVYIKRIDIIAEKMVNYAVKNKNISLAQDLLKRLTSFKQDALASTSNNFEKSVVYCKMGLCNFEYAYNFLQGDEMVTHLKEQTLPILKKFYETRKNLNLLNVKTNTDKLDLQRGQLYLAKTYQVLYEKTCESHYKTKARNIWRQLRLPPIVIDKLNIIPNPLKYEKNTWIKKLNNINCE